MRKRPPCDPECQERTATCHGTGKRYIEWRDGLNDDNATKRAENDVCRYFRQHINKHMRG